MRQGNDQHGILLGLAFPPQPPASSVLQGLSVARAAGLASFTVWDHLVDFAPEANWVQRSGMPASPHENLEYQTLLGFLSWGAGDVRIGVGVTEAVRRHPVVIAQAALTLSHLVPTRPILGIGAGEAANTVPYGLAEERPVKRLEEALAVVRECLHSTGPIDLDGDLFPLDGARLDLAPGPGVFQKSGWAAGDPACSGSPANSATAGTRPIWQTPLAMGPASPRYVNTPVVLAGTLGRFCPQSSSLSSSATATTRPEDPLRILG